MIRPSLSHRTVHPERMDDPRLDPRAHRGALAGLERLNRWAAAARAVAVPAARVLAGLPAATLLDAGCGGGDVAVAVARRLEAAGTRVELTLADRSVRTAAWAARSAARAGIPARGLALDIATAPPPGRWDVVTCTLLVHHLDDEAARRALAGLAAATRRVLVVVDLARSAAGLVLARVACTVLTRSPVVRTDGPLSVRAAFTPAEATALARAAGLSGARVERVWPSRWRLVWSPA